MHDNLPSKKEQITKIKNGKGVQHILDEAYKILENPMLIFDMEYKLIASPDGAVNDDRIWNEFMVHGFLCNDTIAFCKNESFIDSVANSTLFDGVTYLISNKLKYDRIFGQLYNKNHMPVADMVMVACDKPFNDDTPELVKTLCNVLSKELGNSGHYQDYGHAYQESIIKKLIDRNIEDKGTYSAHVANIDVALKTNVFLSVVDISKDSRNLDRLAYFRDLFRQTQDNYKYYIYSDYIIALISSVNHMRIRNKKDIALCEIFKEYDMFVGLSSPFQNLFELRQYYNEAIEALRYGIKANDGHHIFMYDDGTISPFDDY